MQRNTRWSTHRCLPCANWCETRFSTVSVPPCDRLDFETIHVTHTNGLRRTSQAQLDDLDFADDLVLLSHIQQQMQEKTNIVAEHSTRLGLNIHR